MSVLPRYFEVKTIEKRALKGLKSLGKARNSRVMLNYRENCLVNPFVNALFGLK